ncbi:MAG: hypothetical protein A2X49_09390 [Lentisphaerae bacterium GWF2_52_8]|nr:MAG: hypothetical protein A2X49_09390 [Lentisphaerae bacterium GWF2_52_8]
MGKTRASFYPGDVPAKPGVYVFRDRFGEIIYVGKASNLRRRVSHYFQASASQRADPKLRSLISSIANWEVFPVKNEDESLILESRLIKDYAPRYNILMRDDKRYLLIKINLNEKFPRLMLARVRKDDSCRYFGPFPKGTVLRDTLEFLTRHFKLRSCKPAEPGEHDHKHCLAKIVRDCCRPCTGEESVGGYRRRVEDMLAVLSGNVKELVAELQKQMADCAKNRSFEKAAKLRDIIANIEEVFGAKNRSFRFASLPSVTGDEAVRDLQEALRLPGPPNLIEAFDISNISGQYAVASMVCFENGRPDRKNYRRFRIRETTGEPDDFAMMAETVSRRYARKLAENAAMPSLILVDGGKGQLNAALGALRKLKVNPLPVIGLAKKNEEIFVPGRSSPLILERSRTALKLLQAIRDEAHRFAVSYHRQLRSKRLQESVLDDISGIGETRKTALLRVFGSVRELRKTSPGEIAECVPGFSKKLASELLSALKKD